MLWEQDKCIGVWRWRGLTASRCIRRLLRSSGPNTWTELTATHFHHWAGYIALCVLPWLATFVACCACPSMIWRIYRGTAFQKAGSEVLEGSDKEPVPGSIDSSNVLCSWTSVDQTEPSWLWCWPGCIGLEDLRFSGPDGAVDLCNCLVSPDATFWACDICGHRGESDAGKCSPHAGGHVSTRADQGVEHWD